MKFGFPVVDKKMTIVYNNYVNGSAWPVSPLCTKLKLLSGRD
jgi:hypothetical protein